MALFGSRIGLTAILGLILSLAGCDSAAPDLVSVSSAKEANRILVALAQNGVQSGTMKDETSTRGPKFLIRVQEEELRRAREILVQLDLPTDPISGFEQMFKQSGLIPTKTDERARMMHALAGELTHTLETIDGVVRARVHVILPERDALNSTSPTATPTAVILIKYAGERPPVEGAAVRRMAGCILGISNAADPGSEQTVEKAVQVEFTAAANGPAANGGAEESATRVAIDQARQAATRHQQRAQWLVYLATVLGILTIVLMIRLLTSKRSAPSAPSPGVRASARTT